MSLQAHNKPKPDISHLRSLVDLWVVLRYKHFTPNGVQDIVSSYTHEANIFCSVVLWKSGLRTYLKLNYADLENPPEYARDVSNVGHWGVGDVEVAVNSLGTMEGAKAFIQRSFEDSKSARRS